MLFLYNTAQRSKHPFVPQHPDHVSLYVCGPTVYDHIHVGNARLMTVFDTLYRILKRLYPAVTYVRNITDIDDKIIAAALQQKTTTEHIVSTTIAWFHEAVDRLGLIRPTHEPRATEHIPTMIQMIEQLLEKGHAYATHGHVMFKVSTCPSYGELSGMTLEQLQAGARVEPSIYKQSPLDFVLWKPSEAGEPGWESPWGVGRPGWHIECSAMSTQFLGATMDIHGGGRDLLFPHHENERAQTCACTNQPDCASVWMHSGMVVVEQQKMSKSLGNFVTLHQALASYPPAVIRWALLSSHYRHPLSWTADLLHQSVCQVRLIHHVLALCQEKGVTTDINSIDPDIWSALCDDLNTPQALHRLHHLALAVKNNPNETILAQRLVSTLLWLDLMPSQPTMTVDETVIQQKIQERAEARASKDFARADSIRDALLAQGVVLEDSPQGTVWHASHASLMPANKTD